MFDKLLAISAAGLLCGSMAQADMIDDFGSIQDRVNSDLQDEIARLSIELQGMPPVITCGCPHLCGMLGVLAQTGRTDDRAQGAMLAALVRDQAGGVEMAIRSNGRITDGTIGAHSVKMSYAITFDAKGMAAMIKKAGAAVLR